MVESPKDLRTRGYELGSQLEIGETANAKKGYDALITRIQDETRGQPLVTAAHIEQVHSGMAEADPTDVKSPGNGTDEGYFIYWNTENLVTDTINKISDFCKTHDNCQQLGWEQAKAANPGLVKADDALQWSDKQERELTDMLIETNDSLYKKLPDGLERYTFKDDFNRRRIKSSLEAILDESLSVVIREKAE